MTDSPDNEKQTISKAFDSFAKKLKSFSSASESCRTESRSDLDSVQLKIEEREELLRKSVLRNYSSYVNPVSKSVEEDENNLVEAYTLYEKLMELCENPEGEKTTYIKSARIESPLRFRECYTKGKQLVYLAYWLKNEKKLCKYVPFFEKNADGSFYLDFCAENERSWSGEDKTVISILSQSQPLL